MELKSCAFLAFLFLLQFAAQVRCKTIVINSLEVKVDKQYDATNGMWCPVWRNMICGNDGVTYWNECLFKAAEQSKPGLDALKPGICEELECDDCDLDELPSRIEICGTNGQTFKSRCIFECYTENYPMLREVYQHCYSKSPTKDEINNTTAEVYGEIFDAYLQRYNDIITEYDFQNISMKNINFAVEINDKLIQVTGKKGRLSDLSTIRKIEPMYFYAYSELFARTKVVFEAESLEIRIPKFTAVGQNIRMKGRLALTINKNRFELIADVRAGEDDCPLIQAISLRIVDVDDVTVSLKPALPSSVGEYSVDGLIKEKLLTVINDVISPDIVDKLSEIGCLRLSENPRIPRQCYGFFQTKICY